MYCKSLNSSHQKTETIKSTRNTKCNNTPLLWNRRYCILQLHLNFAYIEVIKNMIIDDQMNPLKMRNAVDLLLILLHVAGIVAEETVNNIIFE